MSMPVQSPLIFAIRRVNIQFDKLANQVLKPYNLSISQYKVLNYLYRFPPFTVRQVDIEEFYFITNPTVTGILHTLEKKGLIERKINPNDERSKVISLTDKAYDIKDEMLEIGVTIDRILSESLDPDEKKQLVDILMKILDNTKKQ